MQGFGSALYVFTYAVMLEEFDVCCKPRRNSRSQQLLTIDVLHFGSVMSVWRCDVCKKSRRDMRSHKLVRIGILHFNGVLHEVLSKGSDITAEQHCPSGTELRQDGFDHKY